MRSYISITFSQETLTAVAVMSACKNPIFISMNVANTQRSNRKTPNLAHGRANSGIAKKIMINTERKMAATFGDAIPKAFTLGGSNLATTDRPANHDMKRESKAKHFVVALSEIVLR